MPTIGNHVTSTGLTVSAGETLSVTSGGEIISTMVDNGGIVLISSGGIDSATTLSAGASETVSSGGQASGDQIFGSMTVISVGSSTVSNETVDSGGVLLISKSAFLSNTTLSGGGTVEFLSQAASLTGTLTFEGGNNTLLISANTTTVGANGDLAAISGFGATDMIDDLALTSAGTTLSVTTSGSNTVADLVSGGATVEAFIFSGTTTYTSSTLSLAADAGGHAELVYASGVTSSGGTVTSVITPTASGAYDVTSGNTLLVLNGGSVSAATIETSGTLTVNGGADYAAIVSAGGTETVSAGIATGDNIAGAATIVGGMVTDETVVAGGLLTVDGGAVVSNTTINAGANETILGSAFGDQIYGTQLVSAVTAVVTSETVFAGGNLDLFLKGGIASATTVSSGGFLNINGNAFASNTTLVGGGTLDLQSPKANVTGTLTFSGGSNVLEISDDTDAGQGATALISGFSSTDKINITSSAYVGSDLTLSQTTSGSNTVAQVISGGTVVVETFTFAGTTLSGQLGLASDNNGGVYLETLPVSVTTTVTTPTASGAYTETATNTLLVLDGGSVSAATIDAGAFLTINGGADNAATILAGGTETVSAGIASGDQIYGSAIIGGGSVDSETVQSGGQMTVGDGASVSNVTLNGGALVDLASPTAALTGTLSFANGFNTLEASAIANPGFGDQAIITGFSTADKIDVTGIGSGGATLGFSTDGSGNSVATITSGGTSESFVFSDPAAYNSSTMSLMSDGHNGVDLILDTTPVVTFTSLGLSTNSPTQLVNGTVNVAVDPEAVGTTVSVLEGDTAVGTGTVGANGFWQANVAFLNDAGANTLTAADTDGAGNTGTTNQSISYTVNTAAAAFTPGDLVISLSGDSDGSGDYTDNQASPLTLEQITTSGQLVSQIVLPQTTSVVNGVTEYAISDEYGSSSEGSVELSADGHSLVIAGYGVNADAYNEGGAAVYGNAALGQSTSVPGGPYTVVPRVVADINADGVIDTSTAIDDIYNTNNPRSVATVDGSSFWLSGQGVKGDTTQGVFYATDGASSATAINTATDTRTVEIYNGQVYVSADSTQGADNISDYGNLPTSATSPTVLTGISNSVVLTSATANTVNTADIGQSVNLSPENFFFANADTLYVADGGDPKEGGVGDGGLQKWVFNGTAWTLQYTLSAGLNLVPNSASHGTSGLIGLTGEVVGNTVELFATNETLSDLDQTYVYAITDQLSSTTGAGESFTAIMTASAGENIRGISFAPTAYAPTITGTVAGQTTTSEAPISPFSGVTVADQNSNATETLTITVGGTGGTLSGTGLSGGPGGIYTLSGTAGVVTSELDALTFTPTRGKPGTNSTSTFTLSDESSANSTPTVDTTTSVIDNDPPLAAVIWKGPSTKNRSGSFDTGSDWNSGTVPDAGTRAELNIAGTYMVTSAQANTVGALTISHADATLSVAGASFTVLGYTKNAGTIAIADGATLQLAGSMNDSGTVALDGAGDTTKIVIAGSVTLSGGGQLTLSDSANNAIYSNGASARLVNDDTISGAGTIGDGQTTLVNNASGVINASGNTALILTHAGWVNNRGLIEATGSGGLVINGNVTNTGTLGAAGGELEVTGKVTGNGDATIGDGSTLALDGKATLQTVTFGTSADATGGVAVPAIIAESTGTLALGLAQDFAGTVAGFVAGDAIDLESFAYSTSTKKLSITGVTTSGNDTLVTIKDGGLTATIALLNQFAGEYGTSASDYSLSSDNHTGTAGTLFQLAAAVA